ncbi:MAG TPA: DUF2189 domain-containing protein, partial [Gammaproteobacteria bacterium]|nr:DUF2189 domain-containing protein [Gammaproteobacteria bacterium]
MQSQDSDEDAVLPFVAPCRQLAPLAPFHWLVLGWRDFRRAWPQSLAYGVAMAATMGLVVWLAWRYGSYWFMLAMLGGFVFMAPVMCIGLYAISAQLERNQPVSLVRALRAGFRRYLSNEMVFALVLLVLFLVWARAGAMVSVFFPVRGNPTLADLSVYLSVGTAVGAIFAALTFSISAFSLPMIMHRRVDAVTAVVTSFNAVLRNKLPMMLWLAMIVAGLLIGAATAFVGLAIVLPVIGHAVWHGYLEAIDASDFPRHDVGITAT